MDISTMNIPQRKSSEKARDYALRVLRDNIITLTLEPGCRVSEKELADELGLSRTPVREALMDLANYSIIETYPQHGSIISMIDYRFIEEASFMRMALETLLVEQACDIVTKANIEELEDIVQIQKMYMENGNARMLLEMDNRFHHTLFSMCDKLISYSLMQSMMVHFDRVRQLSLTTNKDIKIVKDHAAILDAIKHRDKTAARDRMVRHLSRFKADKTLISEQYHQYIKE